MAKKKTSSKKTTKNTKKTQTTKGEDKKMMQTHAKEEQFEPTTLDQIWGDDGNTKYGTTDEATYLNKLQDMDKSDLQSHAGFVGIVPVDDREILTKKLIQAFKKYVSGFQNQSRR